jgi:hypothetical protein
MLKKVEARCKRCRREFYKRRTEQEFVEKASKKTPQGLPHGEALPMALFPQSKQKPAKHLLTRIWGLSFESR